MVDHGPPLATPRRHAEPGRPISAAAIGFGSRHRVEQLTGAGLAHDSGHTGSYLVVPDRGRNLQLDAQRPRGTQWSARERGTLMIRRLTTCFALCAMVFFATFGLANARAPFHTSVKLRLTGALVATGVVRSADGPRSCVAHRHVLIQKRGDGGGWQAIGSGDSHPNGSYRVTLPDAAGSYRAFVKKVRFGVEVCSTAISRIITHGGGGGGDSNCTPGYSPCLIWHGGADYDCYGGSGNGPYYTAPGQVYTVTGSDPYGLDADHDGLGCE
jgi:hypothetical protein